MIFSKHKTVLLFIFIVLLLSGLGLYVMSKSNSSNTPENEIPPQEEINIKGTLVCLPHKNTEGPQTLECAYGLQDSDGNYYGLSDNNPAFSNLMGIPTNTLVEVQGNFTPRNDTKYQSIGTIEVANITRLGTPERMTLEGIYLCLPHKDTEGPQTDECANGIETADGKYYALDFGLSSQTTPDLVSGKSISVSGVFTPVEMLSSSHWQIYPIEGILSVTASVKKL